MQSAVRRRQLPLTEGQAQEKGCVDINHNMVYYQKNRGKCDTFALGYRGNKGTGMTAIICTEVVKDTEVRSFEIRVGKILLTLLGAVKSHRKSIAFWCRMDCRAILRQTRLARGFVEKGRAEAKGSQNQMGKAL